MNVNDLYLQMAFTVAIYNKIPFTKLIFETPSLSQFRVIYEEVYVKRIHSLKDVSLTEVIHSKSKEEVQVRYSNLKEFKAFAKHLKIMSDSRVN